MSQRQRLLGWVVGCLLVSGAWACAEGEPRPSGMIDGAVQRDAGSGVDAEPDAISFPDAAELCRDVDCSALTDSCNIGVCNPDTGACEAMAAADGAACDDGDACTTDETCTMGACAGAAVDCSPMSDMCNVGTCNGVTGACEPVPIVDGTLCDDDDLCTIPDVCESGACVGRATDCSRLGSGCNAGVCNPMTGGCELSPLADGTACDDEDLCTLPDVCTMGVCGGRAVDCSALSRACYTGSCSMATGGCEAVMMPDGSACDDGDDATSGDMCMAGVCSGTSSGSVMFPTSAAEVCTTGACSTLGTGGGGRYFRRGDYLEETVRFGGTTALSSLSLDFEMSDLTSGCAVGDTHAFSVSVGGRTVGTYSFVTGDSAAGRRTISERYTFAGSPASGTGATRDQYTIRVTASTTVCPGGSSWNWFPGGIASP